MKKLLWYSSSIMKFRDSGLPGMKKFCDLYEAHKFGADPIFFDRTGTIKYPINMGIVRPLPQFRRSEKSYGQICDERALEILKQAGKLNVDICVMYSGGIDSTCVLVALLKNATEEQKNRIVVYTNEYAVIENKNMYYSHILNKLRVEPSGKFIEILGSKNIIVTGENNDSLFGGNMPVTFKEYYGVKKLHEPYSRELLTDYFQRSFKNLDNTNLLLDIFEKMASIAPIQLTTNAHVMWWFVFTCRYEMSLFKPLTYVRPDHYHLITDEYVNNYYFSFHDSEDFQLWAMTNINSKIGDSWKSYKQVVKDYIFTFDGNEEYRKNKIKFASFWKVAVGNESISYMNDKYEISKDIDIHEYFNPNNDFVDGIK